MNKNKVKSNLILRKTHTQKSDTAYDGDDGDDGPTDLVLSFSFCTCDLARGEI